MASPLSTRACRRDRAHYRGIDTFRALAKTYGQMWLRCDVCRRYARLKLRGLHDVDYRTKTFSCSVCGSEAYFCLIEPTKECKHAVSTAEDLLA